MGGEKHHADWPHFKCVVTHLNWVLNGTRYHFHKYWVHFFYHATQNYHCSIINFELFGFGLQISVKIWDRFPLLFKSVVLLLR